MLRILGFTTLAVLGLLLVACPVGGSEPNGVCGGEDTYHIVGEKQKDKEDEFAAYKMIDLRTMPSLSLSTMSEAIRLTRNLFQDSIQVNGVEPYGMRYQKYNYVVCGEDLKEGDDEDGDNRTIWVAKWAVNEILGTTQCPDPIVVADRRDRMIDFFPQEVVSRMGLGDPQSPCWLSKLTTGFNSEDREKIKDLDGLLDAISKHYMIAQGAGMSIGDFNPNDPAKWSSTKVRYAGEMIVDVENCEYWLNNGSGTYGPTADELQTIAEVFSRILGVGPTFVIAWDDPDNGVAANVDGPTKIHAPLDCGNPQ